MAKDKQESVFEVSKIRELIELMQDHELSEVDLRQSDQRIRLRKGHDQPVAYAPAPMAAAPAGPAPAAGAGPAGCLLYTSPSPRDRQKSRMPSSA